MDNQEELGLGVRMVLAAAVSAVVVAGLTIAVGRALMLEPTTTAPATRTEPLILVAR
jgi:hypothetical protein